MAKPTIDSFARDVTQALGERLVSLVLYGSTARGTHVPDRSDVNTVLVIDRVDDNLFARLDPAVRAWTRAGHPAPLIFTEREWRESADVFPIEYEDMRQHHQVLAGRDPWLGVTVRWEEMRHQLEGELVGKLVRVRQAYAALRGDPKRLAQVIAGSVGGFLTMLRAALRLAGKTPPAAATALVEQAGTVMGFPAASLRPLVSHAAGERTLKLTSGDPLPAAYLLAVERAAEFVDQLTQRKESQ
ncbi:MAG TPA: nucleotidyltransferase domain-containing protein [Gemmatimonadales bacterium]|nr:nucleotidyltransferase domain-containing protein [Gemmatimonadales bacterium]